MKKVCSNVTKWFLLTIGLVSVFSSLFLVSVGAATEPASGWAQCGADSYVDCTGGVRCTTQDNVGCTCYNSNNRVVVRHKCSALDFNTE